jgi:two-component system chemotaxis response regulator CheB
MNFPEPAGQSRSDIVPFRLLAIGSSAGGITAMLELLSSLSSDFPIPMVVLQHLPADFKSRLPDLLEWKTPFTSKWAEDGERPSKGTIHVAPPGMNLAIDATGRLECLGGSKPPLGWPSVDIFLKSMAAHVGEAAIAIVLSGMLYDGADGIAAVRRAGGATMVQDPVSAEYPSMPTAAIDLGRADLKLELGKIAEALQILAAEGVR